LVIAAKKQVLLFQSQFGAFEYQQSAFQKSQRIPRNNYRCLSRFEVKPGELIPQKRDSLLLLKVMNPGHDFARKYVIY